MKTEDYKKKFIDSLQEESASDDFEMALAEMIDKAQTSVVEPWVIAAQWKDELIKLAKSEEPVSEDLGEYINELSKQFPEVSFAKLSRIAVRVAKWQKEQLMAKADNGRVDSVSNRQTRAHITVTFDSPRDIEVLDRLKVIVIKVD